ncbi:hypothetical protein AAOE16_02520 [Ekhidna sp. MALMAid0563]|uniref:hypothetical protein n=1 Tax=Ekhidna sp. MALMAid0563 TaxID=3143937 RepID=UPI0032DE769E
MKKLPFLLFFVLFSCFPERDIKHPDQDRQEEVATDAIGKEYPGLDPYKIYCGPGWGIKFCRFLLKYDNTTWANAGSRIKFSNFYDDTFISISNLDSIAPYAEEGWRTGETTYGEIKWNIEIKIDQEDVLSFGYDYYGSSEEIEYSIIYRCEVIDGVLNFSFKGQTFIFNPS